MKGSCLACNQSNCIIYFRKNDKILSCDNCGAIFTEDEELATKFFHHEQNIDPTLFQKIIINVRGYNLKRNSEAYTEYLKLKTDMKFKNALDIGTNYGHLVKQFTNIGIDAYGIESEQYLVKLANSKRVKWVYFE